MYQVEIKWTNGESEGDYFPTKAQAVKFIAKYVEEPQRRIHDEVNAKDDSVIYRDTKGWRARITYVV